VATHALCVTGTTTQRPTDSAAAGSIPVPDERRARPALQRRQRPSELRSRADTRPTARCDRTGTGRAIRSPGNRAPSGSPGRPFVRARAGRSLVPGRPAPATRVKSFRRGTSRAFGGFRQTARSLGRLRAAAGPNASTCDAVQTARSDRTTVSAAAPAPWLAATNSRGWLRWPDCVPILRWVVAVGRDCVAGSNRRFPLRWRPGTSARFHACAAPML